VLSVPCFSASAVTNKGCISEIALVSPSKGAYLRLLPVTFCAISARYALLRIVAISYGVNDGYDEVMFALSYSIMYFVYMSLCCVISHCF